MIKCDDIIEARSSDFVVVNKQESGKCAIVDIEFSNRSGTSVDNGKARGKD